MFAKTVLGSFVVILSLMSPRSADACGIRWFCHVCRHVHCACHECSGSGRSSSTSGSGETGDRALDGAAEKDGARERSLMIEQSADTLDKVLRDLDLDPNTLVPKPAGGVEEGARSLDGQGDRGVTDVIAIAAAIPKIIAAIERLKDEVLALKKANAPEKADANVTTGIPKILAAIALLAKEIKALKTVNETSRALEADDAMSELDRKVALLTQEVAALRRANRAAQAVGPKKPVGPKTSVAPKKPVP